MSIVLQQILNIKGYLRDDEAELLHHLAKTTSGNEAVVEIGSWKGKSTVYLALGSKEGSGSLIYAIDPHTGSPEHKKKFGVVDTFKEFKNNLKKVGVTDIIRPLRMSSHQASHEFNQPIKLLFIDGEHSYKSVKQDFIDWSPKLTDGGVIAFHDTISWPGPRKLVLEEIYHGKNYKNIKLLGSITYAKKTANLTLIDKSGNYYALIIRNLRNFFSAVPFPKSIRSTLKQILQKIQ